MTLASLESAAIGLADIAGSRFDGRASPSPEQHMPVIKVGDRYFTKSSKGVVGKRGFLSRETALAAIARGKALGGGGSPTPQHQRATMPNDVGTRSKAATTIGARVGMDVPLVPRASDLRTLLKGFVAGLQKGPPVPNFSTTPGEDSDDYQIGVAMGDSIGHYMGQHGMTKGDWKKLSPAGLPDEPSAFAGVPGLDAVLGIGGEVAAKAIGAATFGLFGGDNAILGDVVPGKQTGGAVLNLLTG